VKGQFHTYIGEDGTTMKELVLYQGEHPVKSILLEPDLYFLIANNFVDFGDGDTIWGETINLPDDLFAKVEAFIKANEELQKYVLLLAPLLR